MKPYLIRAVYQWALDNGLTPHILVDVDVVGTQVPQAHVDNGSIVLNIHPHAVNELDLGNEWLLFSARFSGQVTAVEIPVTAVQAIFVKENGQGITFPESETVPQTEGNDSAKHKVPSLRLIK